MCRFVSWRWVRCETGSVMTECVHEGVPVQWDCDADWDLPKLCTEPARGFVDCRTFQFRAGDVGYVLTLTLEEQLHVQGCVPCLKVYDVMLLPSMVAATCQDEKEQFVLTY